MENGEFSNLARELPLARAITGQHIDKTTMVRLALSYIKLHKVIPSPTRTGFDYDHCWTNNLLELMDCFLMVLNPEGDVLYVSETISIYLGLSQVDMTGNSIAEYIHPEDWPQFHAVRVRFLDEVSLKAAFTPKITLFTSFKRAFRPDEQVYVSPAHHKFWNTRTEQAHCLSHVDMNISCSHLVFCSSYEWPEMCSVRVKSSLTKRANKKDSLRASPGFKVLRMDLTYCSGCRLVVCSSLPSPILSSISIRPTSFVITTAVDLSIVYVDSRADELLCEHQACPSMSLKGVSFYTLIHVDDVEIIRKMHLEVFKLGSYRPPLYRIIVQGQHSYYIESNVFRYTSHSNKTLVDSITIVSHFL